MRSAENVVGLPQSADDGLVRAYCERTPGSAASFEAARRVLPGGETRAVTSYPPYPVIVTEGHGAWLTDVDGHVYLDLVNNYTAMVHGSAFAPATEAVAGLLPHGFAFASPHPYQVALAELLAARIVARATGRRRLLMFDGAYHGSATLFLPGFLAAVAELARDRDVLFVLDEVQGLRNGFGGEQGRLGLTPDLTLLGKIIGGGFPIGAVGGRADLHLALLLNGVYTTPRGMINLSTALSPGDLDDIAAAYEAAFTMVRGHVE